MKKVIAIRTCMNWLNDLKMVISISVIKDALDALQLWKKMNYRKMKKK